MPVGKSSSKSVKPARKPATRRAAAPARAAAEGPEREKKKKQILRAAAKVFADKGYHGCRISDVADEAGVAYGLVYHYFGNKDGLLAAVFDTNWAFFKIAVENIAGAPGPSFEKLAQIVELAFQALELAPLFAKVLVLEFGRNARIGEALENPEVARVFQVIAGIFEEGRQKGELRADLDPAAMSVFFVGALESAFVTLVLTQDRVRGRFHVQLGVEELKRTLLAIVSPATIGAPRPKPA